MAEQRAHSEGESTPDAGLGPGQKWLILFVIAIVLFSIYALIALFQALQSWSSTG